MFSNRFNTRNDPLLEAAEAAMKDGDVRRQAEAFVNEQFGVYSRKAVVREELAAYDAALEEAYGALKEGKSLDPVGREDKDIDNDGDHDKSDKYLLNRRKTIGRAMGKKMEEGTAEAETSMSVTKDNKPSTPAQTNASTSGPSASDKAALASKIKTMREEQIDELYGKGQIHKLRKGIRDEGQALSQEYGEGKYHNKRKRTPADHGKHGAYLKKARKVWDKSKRADALADAIAAKNLAKKKQDAAFAKNPRLKEETQVDEAAYSAKAARAGKDIGKPGKQFSKIAKSAGKRYGSEERGKKVAGAILARIRAKHMKEENLDEVVSKAELANFQKYNPGATLGQYMNAIKGKTAIAGGRNDPSSKNFKADPTQGDKRWNAPTGTTSSTSAKDTGLNQSRVAIKPASGTSADMSPTSTKDQASDMTPASLKTNMSSQAAFIPQKTNGTDGKTDNMPNMPGTVATAKKATSDTGGFMNGSSTPEVKRQQDSRVATGSTMAESVQIGDYKYRIV